jgi:hypothetical protein
LAAGEGKILNAGVIGEGWVAEGKTGWGVWVMGFKRGDDTKAQGRAAEDGRTLDGGLGRASGKRRTLDGMSGAGPQDKRGHWMGVSGAGPWEN